MPPKKRKGDVDFADTETTGGKKTKPENGSAGSVDGAAATAEDEAASKIKLEGSMISGEVLFCGGTNWDVLGRSQAPKGVKNRGGRNIWSPHRLGIMKGVRVRTVVSGCCACHCVLITSEGAVYTWGRNEKGQLGHGDTNRRDVPTQIESLKGVNIVDAACGRNHTLLLTENGTVYSFGDNKMGQLGLGHQTPSVPVPAQIVHKGPPFRRVACGGEFSLTVDVRGNLFSFGSPEYGQLGQNSDGKFFVTSNKLTFCPETKPRRVQMFVDKTRDGQVLPITDVEVADLACGVNHTIILDRKKRIFTWGFGGYGRLGHSGPKDEWIPRLLKGPFDGPNRGGVLIAAGSAFSMATNEYGALYLWGQNKPTGEAAMYPKPVQDLNGWKVRSIGCCNRSIVLAADESVISWGPSPTFGELGYGENKPKSSTMAQELKSIPGVYIQKIACGYGHALMIARTDTDADLEAIEKLPCYVPGSPST